MLQHSKGIMALVAKRLDGGTASPKQSRTSATYDFLRTNGMLPYRGQGRPRKYTPEEAKQVAREQKAAYARKLAQMVREAKAAMAECDP